VLKILQQWKNTRFPTPDVGIWTPRLKGAKCTSSKRTIPLYATINSYLVPPPLSHFTFAHCTRLQMSLEHVKDSSFLLLNEQNNLISVEHPSIEWPCSGPYPSKALLNSQVFSRPLKHLTCMNAFSLPDIVG
jgi:hypothetical protein